MNLAANFSVPKFDVALDRSSLRTGKVANGYVQFRVDRELPLSEIRLTFRGVAQSTVQYTQRREQYDGGLGNQQGMYDYDNPEAMAGGSAAQRMAIERRALLCMQLPLAHFEDGLGPGEGFYQLPFQLPIPTDTPPSIQQFRGNSSMAFLCYTLSLELLQGAPGLGLRPLPAVRVPVNVAPSLPEETVPVSESDSQEVSSFMGFGGKGLVTLKARLESNVVAAGEALGCVWQVCSDGTGRVGEVVTAKLMKKAQISAQGRSNKAAWDIVAEASWPVLNDEETGAARGFVAVPAEATPSAHVEGMVDVSYALVVEAQTGFASKKPRVRLPVQVVVSDSTASRDAGYPSHAAEQVLSGGMALGTPIAYCPDPDFKEPSTATGWSVLPEDPETSGGALDDFAAYSAMDDRGVWQSMAVFPTAADDEDPYVN